MAEHIANHKGKQNKDAPDADGTGPDESAKKSRVPLARRTAGPQLRADLLGIRQHRVVALF